MTGLNQEGPLRDLAIFLRRTAYTRHLDAEAHHPGKRNTQKIERKHLTLRARLKRLVRKTIGFSRSIAMHDIVIGLFVKRYECGLPV